MSHFGCTNIIFAYSTVYIYEFNNLTLNLYIVTKIRYSLIIDFTISSFITYIPQKQGQKLSVTEFKSLKNAKKIQ